MKYLKIHKSKLNEDYFSSIEDDKDYKDDELSDEYLNDLKRSSFLQVTPFTIFYMLENIFKCEPSILYGGEDSQANKNLEYCHKVCINKNNETGEILNKIYHSVQRISRDLKHTLTQINIDLADILSGFYMGFTHPIFALSALYLVEIDHDNEYGVEIYNSDLISYSTSAFERCFLYFGNRISSPIEISNNDIEINLPYNTISSEFMNLNSCIFSLKGLNFYSQYLFPMLNGNKPDIKYFLTDQYSHSTEFSKYKSLIDRFMYILDYIKTNNINANILDVPLPILYFIIIAYSNNNNGFGRINANMKHLVKYWKDLENLINQGELSNLLKDHTIHLNPYISEFRYRDDDYKNVKENLNNLKLNNVKKLIDENIYIPPIYATDSEYRYGYDLNIIKLIDKLPDSFDAAIKWIFN